MKKRHFFKTIFLLVVLTQSLWGVHRYAHYCGDELSAQSIFIAEQGACECPVEDDDDCCTEVESVAQLFLEFTNEINDQHFKTICIFLPAQFLNQHKILITFLNNSQKCTLDQFVLIEKSIPITILHSVFRI